MIDIQLQGLELLRKRLQGVPGAADWAIMRILNDVAGSGKEIAAQDIFARYNLPDIKTARDSIKVDKATNSRPIAIIHISAKRFPIQLFKPVATAKGVDFEEVRGTVSSLNHAFMAAMKYGPNVFSRVGKERGPVRRMSGLSIANMVQETSTVLPNVEARINEQLIKRAAFWMEEALKPAGYLAEKYRSAPKG